MTVICQALRQYGGLNREAEETRRPLQRQRQNVVGRDKTVVGEDPGFQRRREVPETAQAVAKREELATPPTQPRVKRQHRRRGQDAARRKGKEHPETVT